MFNKTVFASAGAILALGAGSAADAGQLTLSIEIPSQPVAEYHKPYVAGWIETPTGQAVNSAFVWYDVKKPNNAGAKWLNDLRTWWRKSGRDLSLPMDGLSGATRAPGRQTLSLDLSSPALKNLKPGAYQMVVEAARENGGHSLVKVPFTWDGKAFSASASTSGELGEVSVAYKP